MRVFTRLSGPILCMPEDNVDTDQIIPARFLTTTRFSGLGEYLFADWRQDAQGRPREDCVLNQARAASSPILVAGRNFGCGSSREHAPHALLDFGFRVVISTDIADIFQNNAQNIGLLAIELPAGQVQELLHRDGEEITVDLERRRITMPDGATHEFEIDRFARHCLLKGMDRLDFLLASAPAIDEYEVSHER